MKNHHSKKPNLLVKLSSHRGLLFHLAGFAAIIWFLFRVLPKPDRIRYPCQQMSITVALGYFAFWSLLWSAIFHGLILWIRKVKYKTAAFSPVILVIFLLIFSVTSNVFADTDRNDLNNQTFWNPIPKEPIGTPQGYNPGRVSWRWDPNATEKDLSGYWWKKENNNQTVIDQMFSSGIKTLTDTYDDYTAWDLLFKYFNQEHGHGEVGYQDGEKIAIKINLNNCGSYYDDDNDRDASPYVIKSLLRQLVNTVNVAQDDITIYDTTRPISNWLYKRVYYEEYPADPLIPEFPDIHYVDSSGGASGREKFVASSERVYFAAGTCAYRTLPTCVADADYLINMPLLKRHPLNGGYGVTLSGKNLFGTWVEVVYPVHGYHESGHILGNPTPQTDLLAHEQIGGKTLLYIGDGTYPTKIDHKTIAKFDMYPFNNDWTNSLFFSQDPVAIDSVMYDFLHTEGTNPSEGSQNYLHQSAVPNPNTYDPEDDGTFLTDSLGVHEHWDTTENIFSPNRYSGPSNNGIDFIAISADGFEAYANGPYYGLIDEPVQFNGYATGGFTPYSWEWTFGDGNSSYVQNPAHIFTYPGNFTINLTVTDDVDNTTDDNTWAIVQESNNPPDQPNIDGPTAGKTKTFYDYNFSTTDPDGSVIWYYIDWGDDTSTGWFGPYDSGEMITRSHKWKDQGTYTIKCKAKDPFDEEGPFGELLVTMPRDKSIQNKLFLQFLERFPLLNILLQRLLIH